ncbi:MAG TPA: serpin family protein [Gemmatimonadaceae bacterium]|nr:serpin family protein [Gemmatimonadaceae bacterium]
MLLRRLYPCLLLVLSAACADSPLGLGGATPDSLKALPRALSDGELRVVASSNRFAFDLFRSINTRFIDTNVFISPLSASFALGMTMNGADGETFVGMTQALRILDTDQSRINAAYRDLIELLLELDPSVDMRIANAIWYRNGFPFHQSFLDTVSHYFDARVAGLNFDDPATVTRINAWADSATAGKIPSVLDRIDGDLVMLLMNAIYFKGSWRSQFDPANTHDAAFTTERGTTYAARMMHLETQDVALSTVNGAMAVDLPYGRAAFTMTAILPPAGTDVDAFIESLDQPRWNAIIDGLHHTRADVYLPKFTMKWEDLLNSDLIAMGMEQAFCEGCADFTRMSPLGDALFIDFVKQNTFVNVNEEGTEAAAVTTVGVEVTSAPPSVRFDRPFVFVIRERLSGTILFIGKVAVPIPQG